MATLYSDEVRRIIKSYPWPEGNRLRIEIVEEPLEVPTPEGATSCLVLKLFRDNFNTFDGVEQLRIAKIIGDLIPRLLFMGIPTRLQVEKGDGQIARR